MKYNGETCKTFEDFKKRHAALHGKPPVLLQRMVRRPAVKSIYEMTPDELRQESLRLHKMNKEVRRLIRVRNKGWLPPEQTPNTDVSDRRDNPKR